MDLGRRYEYGPKELKIIVSRDHSVVINAIISYEALSLKLLC